MSAKASRSELILRLKAGSESAWHQLLKTYAPGLRQYIAWVLRSKFGSVRRVSPDSVDSNLQRVLFQLHKRIQKSTPLRGDQSLTPYLRRMALRACIDAMRKSKHCQTLDSKCPEPAQPEAVTGMDLVVNQEDFGRLQTALASLPEKYRTVIEIHDLRGVSIEELAEREGTTPGAMRARRGYALQKLRKILAVVGDT